MVFSDTPQASAQTRAALEHRNLGATRRADLSRRSQSNHPVAFAIVRTHHLEQCNWPARVLLPADAKNNGFKSLADEGFGFSSPLKLHVKENVRSLS